MPPPSLMSTGYPRSRYLSSFGLHKIVRVMGGLPFVAINEASGSEQAGPGVGPDSYLEDDGAASHQTSSVGNST